MTTRRAAQCAGGFLLGALATWVLGGLTGSLLLPLAVVVLVAVAAWRLGPQVVGAALALGSVTVTAFFAWLFAAVGDGLSTM